ncbi:MULTISPECIES: GNAT family N-acetyltransferase [unclassified Moraxella]|uniref:GNAT family N-acetyltransferase n=1 Tax=unclassified Moraxella TaxID=2685852 RepID=UPI002B40F805|nr:MULTISPECIES: GNAT family N-acetyltransferase [unclassified Moraxella]
MPIITHNTDLHRFETTIDGLTAYLSYTDDGKILTYHHTIVPSQLGGQGLGKALTKYALDHAHHHGKKVVPACGFIAAYIDKNPEYQALLA